MKLPFPLPSMDLMNRLSMGPMTVWTPIIGSATSFLVNGAMLWAVFRLARRDFPLSRIPEVRGIALALAMLFIVEAVCGLIHFNGRPALAEIIENTTFLAFLPIYSRLSLSAREPVRDAIEIAAPFGAFAGLALGLFQVWHYGGMRAEGGAGNATPFAIANVIVYLIALLAASRSKGRRRALFGATAFAAAASIIFSGTRGLWPALIIVPVIIAVVYRRHVAYRSAARMLLSAFLLVAIAGFITADFIGERVSKGMQDVTEIESGDYSNSFGERVVLWKVGIKLVEEAPIFGQGPGEAQLLLIERSKAAGLRLTFSHFHNVFLTYAVRDGVFGILMILGIIIVPPLLAARRVRSEIEAYGLAIILSVEACYLLSGIFGMMFGQDIFDAVFIASMITGTFFVFGDGSRREDRAGEQPGLPQDDLRLRGKEVGA